MSKTEDLFQLVQNLSRNEKIYFKVNTGMNSKEKKYLNLFDAVSSMKEYNEEVLIKKFPNFRNNFSAAKGYLYKMILKSLRNYHSGSSVEMDLRERLDEIDILFEKGLYSQCEKIIKKAEKLAMEYERFEELGLVWGRKVRIMQLAPGSLSREELEDFFMQIETNNKQGMDTVRSVHIVFRFLNILSSSGSQPRKEVLKGLGNVLKDPFLEDLVHSGSFWPKYYYYLVWGHFYALTGDKEKEFEINRQKFNLFQANPNFSKEWVRPYTNMLGNLLKTIYNKPGTKKEIEEVLKIVEGLPEKDIYVRSRKFCLITYCNYFLHALDHDYEKFANDTDTVVGKLEDNSYRISNDDKIAILYNCAFVQFATGDFKKSIIYLNLILNEKDFRYRKDVYRFCLLLRLVNHFSLENYELLDYLAKAAYLHFKKERPEGFENAVAKYFSNAASIIDKDGKMAFVDNLGKILHNYENTAEMGFNATTVKDWINAFKTGQTYGNYLKNLQGEIAEKNKLKLGKH